MSNAVGRAIAVIACHGPSGLANELQGEVEALKAHVAALETENSLLREKCLAAHCRAEAFAGEFDRRVKAETKLARLREVATAHLRAHGDGESYVAEGRLREELGLV